MRRSAGDRAPMTGGGAAPALSSDVSEIKRRGSWRFFRMNPVRDLLKAGKTVVGTAGSLYEDNMAMLADSGLDFILFDSQHAPVEVKQYQRSIQAMRGKKAAPTVRMSSASPSILALEA